MAVVLSFYALLALAGAVLLFVALFGLTLLSAAGIACLGNGWLHVWEAETRKQQARKLERRRQRRRKPRDPSS